MTPTKLDRRSPFAIILSTKRENSHQRPSSVCYMHWLARTEVPNVERDEWSNLGWLDLRCAKSNAECTQQSSVRQCVPIPKASSSTPDRHFLGSRCPKFLDRH